MDLLENVQFPVTYSSLEQYASLRDQLENQERKLALSFPSTQDSSSTEKLAKDILQSMKEKENQCLYGGTGELLKLEPGYHYGRAIETINGSVVMQIVRKAPKGALLHCHLDAMLPPNTMFNLAKNAHNMCIRTDAPLSTPESFTRVLPELSILSRKEIKTLDNTDVFNHSYTAGKWMLYSTFLERFPGGNCAAEQWISSKIILSLGDVYHSYQTVNGIWKIFNNSMKINRGLMRYERAWEEYIRLVIRNLVEDGIYYAEIRFALHEGSTVISNDGERFLSHKDMLQIVSNVVAEEKERFRFQGFTFYGLKVIYANLRSCSNEQMKWCMDEAIQLKREFPGLICGFDLCGQEDAGLPLSHWVPELIGMRRKCEELKIDLPFILHAGETLDHGGNTDSNLYDAILLGSKRIGHGFSLARHPLLIDICKKNDIAIEICPISNELLGLCDNIHGHPVYQLMAQSVPCTINTDDPGFFNSSLSHEFYQLYIGSNNMSLTDWRCLAESSFQHSCMTSDEKHLCLQKFREDWEAYCEWIVSNYGSHSSPI